MAWKDIFGWWCTCTSVAFIWPQVVHVYRHDSTHGLSPMAYAYGILGSNVWFAYSWCVDRPAGWGANLSFTLASTLISFVLIRHRSMKPWLLLGAFALSVVVSVLTRAISIDAIGWAAIVLSISGTLPQFFHVVRTQNLHGISVVSYSILVTSCVSWFMYGVFLPDPLYWYPQLLFIPANAYILWRAHSWHRNANSLVVV